MTNENKLEILVVEDTPKFIDQAKEFLDKRIENGEVNKVDYASTLEEVPFEKIKKGRYDFIISDIFFPDKKNEAEKPNGLIVVDKSIKPGIPIVCVTNLAIHQSAHDTLSELRYKLEYAKTVLYPDYDTQEKKPYDLAYLMGSFMKAGKDLGVFKFNKSNSPTHKRRPNREIYTIQKDKIDDEGYKKMIEKIKTKLKPGEEIYFDDHRLGSCLDIGILKADGEEIIDEESSLFDVGHLRSLYENYKINRKKVKERSKKDYILKETVEKYFKELLK